jgi:uncharacterized membrane protein YhaH (DUF805 family)
MSISQILFSSKWRINRAPFWIYSIIINIVLYWIMYSILVSWNSSLMTYWMLLYIPIMWISLMLIIKRLHDLDKSGWMSLLLFIPIANIYIFIITAFFKWTTWTNKFWEDPLGWTSPSEVVEL